MAMEPVIVVHGGSGIYAYDQEEVRTIEGAIQETARRGYQRLLDGGSVLDAVEAAVLYLEDFPGFNAGCGSYLTLEGRVEMDASIQDGETLDAGAVACVSTVRNPVQLARLVMEQTGHVLLVGEGAEQFARDQGVRLATQEELISDKARRRLQEFKTDKINKEATSQSSPDTLKKKDDGHDTVGAVAMDRHGNVAFATSSGGRTGQMKGRVGDSPLIGSGGYADNRCGASTTTGNGEAFMKMCTAKDICSLMKHGVSPEDAVGECIDEMKERVGGIGGAIAINTRGDVGVKFNSPGMSWAAIKTGKITYGIYQGQQKEAVFQ